MPTSSPSPGLSRPFRLGVLALVLPLSFRTFQFFPGMPLLQEAWFVLMALALPMVYLPWRLRTGRRLAWFESYVLLLMTVIPIWSAVAAHHEFSQPLLYGLLAQRGMVLVAAVPLMTRMALDRGWLQFKDLKDALVLLAWGTMGIYLIMSLLLDPSAYFAAYGLGFVSGPGKNAQFKFDVVFIIFGFYYYAFRGLRTHARTDHLLSASFLLFLILVINGRSLLLFLIGVYLFCAIIWTPRKAKLISLLPKIAISFAILWLSLSLLVPEFTHSLVSKFSDAFTVVFTGEMTDDASANSRIQQTLVATPYIFKNWLFGNGIISAQWSGGFEIVIGDYFHPPDIGIIGILFLYGVVGTLLYSVQFIFGAVFGRRITTASGAQTNLVRALKGMIIFTGLRSLATAQFVYFPEVTLFAIALLWTLNERQQVVGDLRYPIWPAPKGSAYDTPSIGLELRSPTETKPAQPNP